MNLITFACHKNQKSKGMSATFQVVAQLYEASFFENSRFESTFKKNGVNIEEMRQS
jgi:hypothetical protein